MKLSLSLPALLSGMRQRAEQERPRAGPAPDAALAPARKLAGSAAPRQELPGRPGEDAKRSDSWSASAGSATSSPAEKPSPRTSDESDASTRVSTTSATTTACTSPVASSPTDDRKTSAGTDEPSAHERLAALCVDLGDGKPTRLRKRLLDPQAYRDFLDAALHKALDRAVLPDLSTFEPLREKSAGIDAALEEAEEHVRVTVRDLLAARSHVDKLVRNEVQQQVLRPVPVFEKAVLGKALDAGHMYLDRVSGRPGESSEGDIIDSFRKRLRDAVLGGIKLEPQALDDETHPLWRLAGVLSPKLTPDGARDKLRAGLLQEFRLHPEALDDPAHRLWTLAKAVGVTWTPDEVEGYLQKSPLKRLQPRPTFQEEAHSGGAWQARLGRLTRPSAAAWLKTPPPKPEV